MKLLNSDNNEAGIAYNRKVNFVHYIIRLLSYPNSIRTLFTIY